LLCEVQERRTLSRRYRLAEDVAKENGARPDDGTLDVDLRAIASALPTRIDATPEGVEQGLAKLVLTIIEVLRKVLEHQAVRRMDGGSLSEEEVERLGLALLSLDGRLRELKNVFGLSDEELEIDLGPLGRIR
jgi:actin-like ATPase involved in cell morphogenesis